jgi:benzoylsuccinyl-CoA thiolase BbsA subunit
MNERLEEIGLSNYGTLYTKTVVHMGVKGFETPYILGWVDLPEKIRLVTQIVYDPQKAADLVTGQKLELVIGKLRTLEDGTEIVGYKYRPIF